MARESTTPEQPPSAWQARPAASGSTSQAARQTRVPARNTAIPASSMRRRPKRSESGP